MGNAPKEGAAPVSAGVRSLMRGNNAEAPIESTTPVAPVTPIALAEPAKSPVAITPKPALPRWYLLAGDVLLVALAFMTFCLSPHPLSWQREIVCVALVILAAVLALFALLSPDGKD